MSAQVDDFSTWGYMSRARPGELRPGQEPRSKPTWASCTSTWALQTDLRSQETSKRPPGPISERFRIPPGGPESPKTPVKYKVFAVFHVEPQTTPRSSKSALADGVCGGPKMTPKRRPGAARHAPGGPQDCSGKHSQCCPVGKACASLRPAPLYLLV